MEKSLDRLIGHFRKDYPAIIPCFEERLNSQSDECVRKLALLGLILCCHHSFHIWEMVLDGFKKRTNL